ncbi:PREDICTED: uncharacterized protein LOC105107917 [Populus euphratica]|uniref:Uncharacterized protein LOC105107917 n=1 Tax=Populus euphratica TaxID=75702 RepID=A0AAJ6SWF4_POPEU|nr:PREDICTED: uncharacterized protein LOC105107917 [Populus euphratica]
MKMMDLLCASPASTAICSSLDHRSIVRHGTRPIDRKSSKSDYTPACSSELPPSPCSPYSRKSSTKQRDLYRKSSAEDSRSVISSVKQSYLRRKSSADISDLQSPPVPGSSSRHLLVSDTAPDIDWISGSDHHEVPAMVLSTQHANPRLTNSSTDFPARRSSSLVFSRDWISEADNVSDTGNKPSHMSSNDSPALRSSSSTCSRHQVVVLRVSIHCKGCEGKVRKHISKMEGVTSFSIDFETKKVTVIGDVTPSGVLASVSKVKKAQLWPSATTSPSSSPFP